MATLSHGDSFEVLDYISSYDSTNPESFTDSSCTSSLPWQLLFDEHGIGEYASKVGDVTGAKSLEDLEMLTEEDGMIDDAARLMGMLMIPKAKFKKLLKSIKNGTNEEDKTTAPATIAVKVDTISDTTAILKQVNTNLAVPPAECVAVCIDRSASMGSPFQEQNGWGENAEKTLAQRSRMDAVKQVFYAFRDRTDTLCSTPESRHEIGLLSFDEQIETHLSLTSSLDRFEEIIDDIEKRGATSIYSAIIEAVDGMLRPVFERQTNSDLRILCLTDGENNRGASPKAALEAVNSIGAVVDAIIVGDNPDTNLRKIVASTKGECFQIRSLSEGFQLMEGEGVISLKARRGGAAKPAFIHREIVSDLSTVRAQEITPGSQASVKTSYKKSMAGSVMSLKSKAICSKMLSISPPSQYQKSVPMHQRRIMKELKQVVENDSSAWTHSGHGVHIFPHEEDMTKMRVLLEGPPGSPFEGGVFLLHVFLPCSYPLSCPNISFQTPVYHPNISESGQICMHLLQEWSPSTTVPKALEAIRYLLAQPDTDEALRQWIAEEVLAHRRHGEDTDDGKRYVDHARAQTEREASKNVEEWKAIWKLGSDDDNAS